jgi:hypothetical protein
MNAANVELTQVVSQVSGPVVLSIADDLLSTQRMTIEVLIESAEVIVNFELMCIICVRWFVFKHGFNLIFTETMWCGLGL